MGASNSSTRNFTISSWFRLTARMRGVSPKSFEERASWAINSLPLTVTMLLTSSIEPLPTAAKNVCCDDSIIAIPVEQTKEKSIITISSEIFLLMFINVC